MNAGNINWRAEFSGACELLWVKPCVQELRNQDTASRANLFMFAKKRDGFVAMRAGDFLPDGMRGKFDVAAA